MKCKLISVFLICALLLSSCGKPASPTTSENADFGQKDDSFGQQLEEVGVYDGKFETVTREVTISCISGTQGAYQIEGNTITFTSISQDSVYAISGQLKGNIIIDVGDQYKFDLEMQGLSVISDSVSPVIVLSGSEVSLTAKKGYQNYLYDDRAAVEESDVSQYSAAIYSFVDLEICGKGSLTLVSEQNQGIHTKDDLQLKNLNLVVCCTDNALKGNDSVEITDANTTLIASYGDGIKTSNSNISEKGNQRGTVSVSGGTHTIFAACDGIDAAYNVVIDGENTVLTIYTDKYSNYSGEVTATDSNTNYIRFTSQNYQYSVKYYNSDQDYQWVNATYHSTVSGGRSNYYYYSYPKLEGYSKVQFFIYSADQSLGQEEQYIVCSELLTPNDGADTFALSARGNQIQYEWTNYTTSIQEEHFGPGRPGGMGGIGGFGGGNTDKGDHSTKGIKAGNEIVISSGSITIKSYDDAIHANGDTVLENGETPLGNITIHGGNVTIFSNDDGLHADGKLTVNGGNITVTSSYEGLEGTFVELNGGNVSISASDDGLNATTTSGTAVSINGGTLYIYCSGDGIDSNSRSSYTGIVFSGGDTVVITTSGGNSSIDSEQGYTYQGGRVLAIMPNGGMTNEATHCKDFNSVATRKNLSLITGTYLSVSIDGERILSAQMPTGINAVVIYLGTDHAEFSSESTISDKLDGNGVYWKGK